MEQKSNQGAPVNLVALDTVPHQSWFQLSQADGTISVWYKLNKAMNPQQYNVQIGDATITVWRVFTWHGLGLLKDVIDH